MKPTLAWALLLLLAGCASPAHGPSSELAGLMQLLPGTYRGQAPAGLANDGEMQPVFHRFAAIDAPQFGDEVLYYQLSADEAGEAPMQMKIFVFSPAAERGAVRMAAHIFMPGQAPGNLDLDPARWPGLSPDALMSFPSDCAFTWRPVAGGYKGTVTPDDCIYNSRAFDGKVRAEMTYEVNAAEFYWAETLYREGMQVIVSTNGRLQASRMQE